MNRIPYGECDYKSIRTGNSLYVDKTRFIEELERDVDYLTFLRPRGFGKSLFLSTMFYYYDKNSVGDFDLLFGDTYIGSHRTEMANRYYVLRFDFSDLAFTDRQEMKETFHGRVKKCLEDFLDWYKLDIIIRDDDDYDSASLLNEFLMHLKRYADGMVYILIDEYDFFANIIMKDPVFFRDALGGYEEIKRFYAVCKSHTGWGGIDRMFITGLTSMTLDGFTSGFNISMDITNRRGLNEMMGFTHDETMGLLEQLEIPDPGSVMKLLADQYGGYMFYKDSDHAQRVLNSSLVMFFLNGYMKTGKIPEELADPNITGDYKNLAGMLVLYRDQDGAERLLQDIRQGNDLKASIETHLSPADTLNRQEFLSMLYYLGLLAIKDAGFSYVTLKTPNSAIRDALCERSEYGQ